VKRRVGEIGYCTLKAELPKGHEKNVLVPTRVGRSDLTEMSVGLHREEFFKAALTPQCRCLANEVERFGTFNGEPVRCRHLRHACS